MIRVVLAALLLASGLASAEAQGFRHGGGGGGRGATPGSFDFYVLALSWSPTFCDSEAGQRNRNQCGIRAKSEFVVHGLWPQFERGYPSYCSTVNRSVPRPVLARAAQVFPEEGLARYQWEKHGTCSGLGPGEYFDDVAAARSKVVIPDAFRDPAREVTMSPQDIERAFVSANRGLRADMIGLSCSRGALKEVRICLSKDVRGFVPCPEVGRSSCRSRDVTLPTAR